MIYVTLSVGRQFWDSKLCKKKNDQNESIRPVLRLKSNWATIFKWMSARLSDVQSSIVICFMKSNALIKFNFIAFKECYLICVNSMIMRMFSCFCFASPFWTNNSYQRDCVTLYIFFSRQKRYLRDNRLSKQVHRKYLLIDFFKENWIFQATHLNWMFKLEWEWWLNDDWTMIEWN